MNKAKLRDVINGLADGTEYFTYQAPEEFHVWSALKPWGSKEITALGLHCHQISFSGSHQQDPTKLHFTKINPKTFKTTSAKIISGTESTSIITRLSGKFYVGTSNDIKAVFSELSSAYKIPVWTITAMIAINPKTNSEIEYGWHNPNNIGTSFYCLRINQKLYPLIDPFEYKKQLVGFRERIAKCVVIDDHRKRSACGFENASAIKVKKTVRKFVSH